MKGCSTWTTSSSTTAMPRLHGLLPRRRSHRQAKHPGSGRYCPLQPLRRAVCVTLWQAMPGDPTLPVLRCRTPSRLLAWLLLRHPPLLGPPSRARQARALRVLFLRRSRDYLSEIGRGSNRRQQSSSSWLPQRRKPSVLPDRPQQARRGDRPRRLQLGSRQIRPHWRRPVSAQAEERPGHLSAAYNRLKPRRLAWALDSLFHNRRLRLPLSGALRALPSAGRPLAAVPALHLRAPRAYRSDHRRSTSSAREGLHP